MTSKSKGFRWSQIGFLHFDVIWTCGLDSFDEFRGIESGQHSISLSTCQKKFLPHYEYELVSISQDDKKFYVRGKLVAIPDAVFYDAKTHELIVVEYKSWDYYAPGSIKPANAFQLLCGAEMIRWIVDATKYSERFKRPQPPKVRAMIRLNNCVVEIKGWRDRLTALRAFAEDLHLALGYKELGARKIAEYFVAYEKVFQVKPKREQLPVLGKISHIRMANQKVRIWS